VARVFEVVEDEIDELLTVWHWWQPAVGGRQVASSDHPPTAGRFLLTD
jgi:hypothetical protein